MKSRRAAAWVVAEVREFIARRGPVQRDTIALRVCALSVDRGLGWEFETASRRIREALNELVKGGEPIVSTGSGFFLAVRPSDRRAAVERLRRHGLACLARAAAIAGTSLLGELHQAHLAEWYGKFEGDG